MKYSIHYRKQAMAACFVLIMIAGELHAQSWLPTPAPIPPDTSHYLVTLWTGKQVMTRRPPDTLMNPATLLIRFRPGVLNSEELSLTYQYYFDPHHAHGKGDIALDYPYGDPNGNRGYPNLLREQVFEDRFWFDSTTNIVNDTLLRNFLIANGGHWLRRLTAASPIDTLTITTQGDTIPSDLPNWMVLNFDSTVNPLYLAYLLVWEFPKDIAVAYPDYHGGVLDGPPSDLYYKLGYQHGIRMIQADTAWRHEVGDTSIIVEVADFGLDNTHPDFGDPLTGKGHKWMAIWNFDYNNAGVDSIPDHGTAMSGIIGALSNNVIGMYSPYDTSVAGIAGGHGTLLPDNTSRGRGVTLAGYVTNIQYGGLAWTSSIFESSSKSPNTPFGLGVNIINCSEGWYDDDTGYETPAPFIPAAVDYAYLNGVTFVAAVYEMDSGVSNLRNYPSDLDDPWVISVGGSWNQTDREKQQQSDFGYTLDLLAPAGAGDPDLGGDPYVLNYTTRKLTPTSPFTYGPYGGTSAAAANVSGSAALLLSNFVHSHYGDTALKHLEPEDVQNILKASAWREDTERLDNTALSQSWVPHNGFGHLDIGHAFQMLDTDINAAPDAGYHLHHVTASGISSLSPGTWSSFVTNFQFSPPWQDQNMGDTFSVGLTKYLAEDIIHGYKARSRSLTYTDTLPDSLENSDTCPLFVWGRSGEAGRPSGWSFADEPNYETGWTKVLNGLGSDPDSLMEGIFVPSNRIVKVETAQYDVLGWSDSTGSYSNKLGHCPPDSVMAVNFTYFGRAKKASSGVQEGPSPGSDSIVVSVNSDGTMVDARFYTIAGLPNATLDLLDVLGRVIYTHPLNYAAPGWNEIKFTSRAIASGAYFCVVNGENYFHVRSFLILK